MPPSFTAAQAAQKNTTTFNIVGESFTAAQAAQKSGRYCKNTAL